MTFDPILAEKRFGYGVSPIADLAPAKNAAEVMARLRGSDDMAVRFPVEGFSTFRERLKTAQAVQRHARRAGTQVAKAEADRQQKALQRAARQGERAWLWQMMMRRVWTRDGFRERLTAFWGDHFTARGKVGVLKRASVPYIEDAIRPHILGRFEDLLISAVTHPLMLHYLDQTQSTGPNSVRARRKAGGVGLNENLAREVLELHTLGVDGGYSQRDVRQLAELFTGLSYSVEDGRKFRNRFAEPGAEEVLGRSYGGGPARMDDIRNVLQDLARHPSTAQHIARKLARHFVADAPPTDLVAVLADRYQETGGDLVALYDVLITHPAAMQPQLQNLRLPEEYIAAALRSLAVDPQVYHRIERGRPREQFIVQLFQRPLAIMGQPWQEPLGPDGWEEGDANWLTPQGIASRLQWALQAPVRLRPDLPDPRAFVATALGAEPPATVEFAAQAAESRREGIALVLASPAFQRR